MEIELIKAHAQDKDFLLHLRKETMGKYLEEAGIHLSDHAHLDRVNEQFENAYIIFRSSNPIGLLKYQVLSENIEIIQFQILSAYQGKGIGTHLLNHIFSMGKKLGKGLTLSVLKQNPAKGLYLRFGFQIVGEDEEEFHMRLVPS